MTETATAPAAIDLRVLELDLTRLWNTGDELRPHWAGFVVVRGRLTVGGQIVVADRVYDVRAEYDPPPEYDPPVYLYRIEEPHP